MKMCIHLCLLKDLDCIDFFAGHGSIYKAYSQVLIDSY